MDIHTLLTIEHSIIDTISTKKSTSLDFFSVADLIIAAIGIFLSIWAIFFTKRSLVMQRIHNEKSMKPLSTFSFLKHPSEIKIVLKNSGVGPLILWDFKVHANSTVYDNYYDVLKAYIQFNVKSKIEFFTVKTFIMSPNDSVVLLHIQKRKGSDQEFDYYYHRLNETKARIQYNDVYENNFIDDFDFSAV